MPQQHPRPTVEEHEALGARLREAQITLREQAMAVQKHYGKSSKQYKKIFQAKEALKIARSYLDDAYAAEQKGSYNTHTYYGDE